MTSGVAPALPAPRTEVSAELSVNIAIGLVCLLCFALLNPFLAVFLLALTSFFHRVPVTLYVLSASIAFTLFFFLREYGVEWFATSTDDVPVYQYIYETNYGFTFRDVWENFITAPNGNELLWQLPWWALLHGFDASSETFVFIHYSLLFLTLFAAFAALSPRHVVPFSLVCLLMTPILLDSLVHIWRQQLASSLLLLGVALHHARGSRSGKWIVIATPLIHFSFLFFVALFFATELLRRYRAFDNKLKFTFALALLMVSIPLMSRAAVFFLDSIGLARIMVYFEGYETDIVRRYVIIAIYTFPMIGAYYLLKNDSFNYLMMVFCLAVFSIALALPGANTIYERLLMSVLPFWGLFFYRCMMMNFSPLWQLPLFVLIFVSGVMRLQALAAKDEGVGFFLAFGHAFDPLMGVVKMLTSL